MPISFIPGQTGETSEPVAYTGNPLKLCLSDFAILWRNKAKMTGILFPVRLKMDPLDELYLNGSNLFCAVIHAILFVMQSLFIMSVILCLLIPGFPLWGFIIFIAGYLLVNTAICTLLLNGRNHGKPLISTVGVKDDTLYKTEYWMYLNGVSVGYTWLQANIDRLSLTFGRPIVGILNPTDGILFDLIQCMVQRNFCYSTQDVRDAYVLIKKALLDEKYEKVVFVLHSQGCIEGGLVIDWLLDEVPQDRLQRFEVYTFGNAANHFSNPHRTIASMKDGAKADKHDKAIRYIEHYANHGDYVAQFGVLNFASMSNRFMGKIFRSPNSGHLLNCHYLRQMFPLDLQTRMASEDNEFMDMEVAVEVDPLGGNRETLAESTTNNDGTNERDHEFAYVVDVNSPITRRKSLISALSLDGKQGKKVVKVRDLSRLWMYRNGQSPPPDAE